MEGGGCFLWHTPVYLLKLGGNVPMTCYTEQSVLRLADKAGGERVDGPQVPRRRVRVPTPQRTGQAAARFADFYRQLHSVEQTGCNRLEREGFCLSLTISLRMHQYLCVPRGRTLTRSMRRVQFYMLIETPTVTVHVVHEVRWRGARGAGRRRGKLNTPIAFCTLYLML